MSDEQIKNALTAEEWANWLMTKDDALIVYEQNDGTGRLTVDEHMMDQPDRHRVAALCLYGQPFGFDAQDIEVLRAVASPFELHHDDDIAPGSGHELIDFKMFPVGTQARLQSLLSRIAALLPPPSEREAP